MVVFVLVYLENQEAVPQKKPPKWAFFVACRFRGQPGAAQGHQRRKPRKLQLGRGAEPKIRGPELFHWLISGLGQNDDGEYVLSMKPNCNMGHRLGG